MTLWAALLAACLLSYLLKLSGYLVPEAALQHEWLPRVIPLLPIALLSSLVVTQAFHDEAGVPTVDARAAGVAVAVVGFWLRAPFLLVIVLAAVTAALVRQWGGGV